MLDKTVMADMSLINHENTLGSPKDVDPTNREKYQFTNLEKLKVLDSTKVVPIVTFRWAVV